MKKIFPLLAAVAMLAVSCQKETPATGSSDNTDTPATSGKLTATIVQTKVTYSETWESNLQPAWEVGDKIIGFDDAGKTYTLTVDSVSEETATLSGRVPDGPLHLIYKSGAQASDISSKTLAIDYNGQAGDKTMPAVMLADGIVEDGSCDFAFINAGSIIGFNVMKGIPSGSNIVEVTVEGENLSAATVALSGSALALNAKTRAGDAISSATLSGITIAASAFRLSKRLLFAVPSGAVIAKVSAYVANGPEPRKIPSTAADREGTDYVTIGGLKWAKWNVGACKETDYGWYFAWAGTEGYAYRSGQLWVPSDGIEEYSYSLSSPRTANAGDYLYVTNYLQRKSHSFRVENAPYQTQKAPDASVSSQRFTKYLGSTSSSYIDPSASDADALKTVLDPEDDAARVNWGSTWRMPTLDEFMALFEACGGTGTQGSPTALSSSNPGLGIYWVSEGQRYLSDYTGVAGLLFCDGTSKLFFPAAGWGYSADTFGYYWSSTVHLDYPYNAHVMSFSSSAIHPKTRYYRYFGIPVRPVSD